jgi:IS30 family transposase
MGSGIPLTPDEISALWTQYKAGAAVHGIARKLKRPMTFVYQRLKMTGGIKPASRTRSAAALSLSDREEISRGIAAGESSRCVARRLGRAPSTVSREIARNGGRMRYRSTTADLSTWDRALRPKPCLLSLRPRLCSLVARKLRAGWSPKQISVRLKRAYPMDPTMQVSHETVYRTLFVQSRGALKQELKAHLRTKRNIRRSRNPAPSRRVGRGQIVEGAPISERPPEVEDRAVVGHWEGDLLAGKQRSHIVTLVERASRFAMLIKIPDKTTDTVVAALAKHIRKLPQSLRKSLTWDRGLEMAKHKDFTVATDVKVYFCDPSSPWQRGSNENTNGLLRQYFPKSTDLSKVSQAELNKVALLLNTRPRITLDAETPAERLASMVH